VSDHVVLRFLAAPGDTTITSGIVSAGRLLEWIDKAAYACAVGWSGGYCVTAYVGNVTFRQSVHPGELVEVSARIVQTGRTSMHVLVSVRSRDPGSPDFRGEAMHCLAVMVAVDEGGRPREIDAWAPSAVRELDLPELISERMRLRRDIQTAMTGAEYTERGTAPRTVLRFLAAPADVNFGGHVHGGTLMRWIDEGAYACAASWAGPHAVAVYAGGIQFVAPMRIGDLVEVDARLIHTTEHSMHVAIEARSASLFAPDAPVRAARCIAVYVVPEGGATAAVPQFEPQNAEDRALDDLAVDLIELRAQIPALPDSLVAV
jgi:4-hydroxybenzoyl-CoA thioesterase